MGFWLENDKPNLLFPHFIHFHDIRKYFFYSIFHSTPEKCSFQWEGILVDACFLIFYFQELQSIECIEKCMKCWTLTIFRLAVSRKKLSIALLTQKLGNKVLKFLLLKWFWHKRKTLLYRRKPLRFKFCLNNRFGIAKKLPKLCKHHVG